MKKRFTFSRFLNNDKLMMLVSLLVAIGIWVMVLTGPMNIVDRVVTTKVTVNLGNSYAGLSGLRVIGEAETDVQVTIEGAWSVISRIDAEDLRVSADLTAITGPGEFALPLLVSRNSAETSYDILNVSPRTVSVRCDYWQEGTIFKVECDTSALTVSDPDAMQIGDPVIDQTTFPNGMVTIEGPKSTVSRIKRVVARVTATEPLTAIRRFEVPLTALDADGNAVELTDCAILEVPTGILRVTVPIWESRRMSLGVTAVNVPEGLDALTLLTVEPQEIEVLGPTAELDALEEQLGALGTVDVRTLSVDHPSVTLPLSLPSTVRGVEVPTVATVSLNGETIAQKELTVTADETNVIFLGGDSKKVAVEAKTFDGLVVVGNLESVQKLTKEDIRFTVQLEAEESWYTPTVSVEGYDDVWVYLPEMLAEETIYVSQK